MTANVLFAAGADRWDTYAPLLRTAFEDFKLDVTLAQDHPAETVDYIVYAPNSPVQDFSGFPRLKLVMNIWAGVEGVVGNSTLTAPLARMVDEHGLTQGMVEWVSGHVLRHHLGMDAHIHNPAHRWDPQPPKLAPDRPVCILGMGALGLACARALRGLGFAVRGWSRTEKSVAGIDTYHGEEGLERALTGAEIAVLLLPLTPETTEVMNAARLARLAPGAVVINPGRGALIDDDALIEALDRGALSHATLDVFRTEPLPAEHPFWAHPGVTVTPHIASETRAATAARVIAENVRRGEKGLSFLHLVDREAGY